MSMDPRYVLAMQAIQDEIASGRLQLDRDVYQNISLPTYRDVTYPTSVGQNTGFLPGNYAGGFGGMPTFGALMGALGQFGTTGTDPRWAMMGYGPGQENLPTRTLGGAEAQRDTEQAMTYGGGPYVGGQQAPEWMRPFQTYAEQYARGHGGIAPTQTQLTSGIAGATNQALQALRADPQYQAADGNRKREMEAQAVAGATGLNAQQAASAVADLRQQSATRGGTSSDQDIVTALGRWSNPQDPAASVNQAMTRLRQDPQYAAADGTVKRQMEAQALQGVVPSMSSQQAAQAVEALRSNSQGSGGLSSNQQVGQIIQRFTPQQGQGVYGGQQGQQQGGPAMWGAMTGPGGGNLGGDYFSYGPQQQGGMGGGMGGVNFAGSGLAGGDYANTAMSPAQRSLMELGRQADVTAQVTQRGQDITQQNNQADVALRALQQESQLRADPFQLERYRRGLGQSGIPNVIGAVAGQGLLPTVQGGYGRPPQSPTMQNQLGQLGGMPTFGQGYGGLQRAATMYGGGRGGGMADAERQMAALPELSQINSRNYMRAGAGGQNYVRSAYKASGMAGSDEDVQEAVRLGLPAFARGRGVPTFGKSVR